VYTDFDFRLSLCLPSHNPFIVKNYNVRKINENPNSIAIPFLTHAYTDIRIYLIALWYEIVMWSANIDDVFW